MARRPEAIKRHFNSSGVSAGIRLDHQRRQPGDHRRSLRGAGHRVVRAVCVLELGIVGGDGALRVHEAAQVPPGATISGLTKPSKVGPAEENEAR